MKQNNLRHAPRKRFGQNFLQDQSVIRNIVDAVGVDVGDVIVEIGPGLGALTIPLLGKTAHLHVVEIDRDLVSKLRANFSSEQLTIHQADALSFDFASIYGKKKIIGNLPYNISTPLLFHLANFGENIYEMHFMLQKEVVERMVAAPSSADYGRLSVMLQYRFAMECMFIVPPEAFFPAPKVESAVVRMLPKAGRCGVAQNEKLFADLVLQAFAHRRKTLRNNLKNLVPEDDLIAIGIKPEWRAENVSVEQYVALSNQIVNLRGSSVLS